MESAFFKYVCAHTLRSITGTMQSVEKRTYRYVRSYWEDRYPHILQKLS